MYDSGLDYSRERWFPGSLTFGTWGAKGEVMMAVVGKCVVR